ncbi:hypothetical protein ACFST9_19060 [Hymenobacter monticola]|uniref:Rax2-like C-terminal domain-containing protein n=1 Tax=Hymenobacter monticola TaxID=1705399 RepID=A0ABY4AZP3_9BACT|nr:hypothetical protein [Hymenobacter monticola]UOE31994.1 hypothetical protein MTP16_12705 [Hymenobacter monticola]
MKKPLRYLLIFLLALGLTAPVRATAPPTTGPSLADALNPDGTLRPGANGSFNARQFCMSTAPDGRPVFRPAGVTGAGDERWADGFGLPGNGINGRVDALAVDGSGNVYAGGFFTQAGGAASNGVAKWNGTTWTTLGMGAANGLTDTRGRNGSVSAIAVAPDGSVYVGGQFNQAGGVPAANVARWDGTTWSPLGAGTGGTADLVRTLAVAPNGDVYAAGDFTLAGGQPASRIAKWNGTAWTSLGSGMNLPVYALAVAANGDLYAGGSFFQAGGVAASSIARWNGTVWSPIGGGMNGPVADLAIARNGDLYASGGFTQAGGVAANHVAKWSGTTWSSLGTGSANGTAASVEDIAIASNGDVYAGGNRITQFYAPLYRWNGSVWTTVGTGLNSSIGPLAFGPADKLCVGGAFTATGDGSKVMACFGIYDPNAPLAIKAAQAAPAAQLFPNPAHGTATLRLPIGAPRLPLTLLDAQGRTVRRYPAPATAEAALDLRGLPTGAYLVRCGEYAQRLVVE